jgi:hypothetical protein
MEEVISPVSQSPNAVIDISDGETERKDEPIHKKQTLDEFAHDIVGSTKKFQMTSVHSKFHSLKNGDDTRTVGQLVSDELCRSNTITLLVLFLIGMCVALEQTGNGSAGFALFVSLFFVVEISIRFYSLGYKRFTRDKFCVMDSLITFVDIIVSFRSL